MSKIKIGKLKLGEPRTWFADCPVCTNPAVGFYSSVSHPACLIWAIAHIRQHRAGPQELAYLELS